MLLTPEKSLLRDKNQAIVVSKDERQARAHRAENPQRRFELRHYKLDGGIVTNEKSCDFLLLNDSSKKAYFIELKGTEIDTAVEQLEASAKRFAAELKNYEFLYRIVCSRALTHNIQKPTYRRFKEKCGKRLQMKERKFEEVLD